ncbi:MAG TPA: glycosyltransferase [Chloroflexota bacterium]|nr:glycosyltransferase [Chloroflexota bacterium]HUM72013.1 glycosyltransferase [Chloroflexota bacterium]
MSILVLNWNGRDLLARYLPPLTQLDYPGPYEILLVDNGSTDDSVAFTQTHFPAVRIIANEENLGFSRGINRGMQQAASDVIVWLNTDVDVRPDWLTELVRPLAANASIGITGAKLYFGDGRTLQHAGAMLEYPLAIGRHRFYKQPDNGQADELCDVDYVTGAALAVRREVLDAIGLMDEAFSPFYYEEVDFCHRAIQAGFRVVYVPTAVATHHESLTMGPMSDRQYYDLNRNRLYYVLKHYTPAQFLEDFLAAERAHLESLTHLSQIKLLRRIYQDMALLPVFGWSESVWRAAISGLLALAESAGHCLRRPQKRGMMDNELLREKAVVQERPFTSTTPLIGPLLAWFRARWNNISTTWYVRPLLQQQNEFNQLLLRHLQTFGQEMQTTLTQLDERLVAQDHDLVTTTRQMAELTMQLKQMNERLAALEEAIGKR